MSMPALSQHSLSVPRSGIRDVFDRVEHVPDAISLCVGEPSATAAPHIVEAACRSIREGHTTYTNVLGIEPFREAVAAYSEKVKGLRYDVDTEIQAVDGATIGLFLAMKALLDAGDEVILPSPYFTSYDAEALMCGGVPVPVALKPEHQMRLNADDIEAAITPRTKAVLLNSPGNPSGAVTPLSELERIADVCIRHDIWVISDEVYHPFVFDGSASIAPSIAAIDGMHERTVVVESLSKTFAMTGWRIGYLLGPEPLIEQTSKLAELMHVLDELDGCTALRLIEPQGAFYAFVDVRACGMDCDRFSRMLLDEEHVAVVPGTAFGSEGAGFVRLSYAGDGRELREGVRRMRVFAERHVNPALGRHTPGYHHLQIMA